MNILLPALAAAGLVLPGMLQATSVRVNDTPPRETGIGRVISQQGNEALHRIRSELATTLRERVALPELGAAPIALGRSEHRTLLLTPAARAAFTP